VLASKKKSREEKTLESRYLREVDMTASEVGGGGGGFCGRGGGGTPQKIILDGIKKKKKGKKQGGEKMVCPNKKNLLGKQKWNVEKEEHQGVRTKGLPTKKD